MTRPSLLSRLRRDERGTYTVEFAMITPTLLLLIMGASDLAYRGYATSVLEGEIQKAARDASMEGGAGNLSVIEQKVKDRVGVVVKNATFSPIRRSYTSYLNDKPERYTDSNNNGQRDAGECYDDINANNQWDSDPGNVGQGGANDVAAYSMTMTYRRLFPMYGLLGWSPDEVITVRTFLRNQPYATQNVPQVRTLCT
jgi:hypothetical protein